MTLVDAGANVGYYTLIGTHLVGETGRIYAFEPENEVYEYLEHNVARAGAKNVHPVQMALSDRRGSMQFWSSALDRGSLSALVTPGSPSVTVETISLDGFFADQGWPRVDLIKLDVEGSEASVLAGMNELSARNASLQLIMEINPDTISRAKRTLAEMTQLLDDLGFAFGYIVEQGLKPISLRTALPRSRLVYNILVTKNER
jgi:FkbM family methyltransferase